MIAPAAISLIRSLADRAPAVALAAGIVFALLHCLEIAATVLPGPRHMGYSLPAVMGLLTNSLSYQQRDAGASQGSGGGKELWAR